MTICQILERIANRGSRWHVQRLEVCGRGVLVTGYDYENYRIGKNKGRPNRHKRIKDSLHQFWLSSVEYDAIIQESKQ